MRKKDQKKLKNVESRFEMLSGAQTICCGLASVFEQRDPVPLLALFPDAQRCSRAAVRPTSQRRDGS